MASRRGQHLKLLESGRRASLADSVRANALLVLGSILVYQVVSSQSMSGERRAASNEKKPDKLTLLLEENLIGVDEATKNTALDKIAIGAGSVQELPKKYGQNKNKLDCQYEKGQWEDCQSNGSQQRVMTLKSGGRECKPNKTIRRDCEAAGCKYARGQWSSGCVGGRRFRVDTLVGPVGGQGRPCEPNRRVTRDCHHTCHYKKSAWSDCSNGFRTRALILAQPDEAGEASGSPPAANDTAHSLDHKIAPPLARRPGWSAHKPHCAKRKLIRRECGPAPVLAAPPTASAPVNNARRARPGAALDPSPAGRQPGAGQTPLGSNNMTPAQRRRLKQIQLKQQQPFLSSTAGKMVTAAGGLPLGTTVSPSSPVVASTATATTNANAVTAATAAVPKPANKSAAEQRR